MATVNLADFDVIVADTSFFVRVERRRPQGTKLASLKRLALTRGISFRVTPKVKIELIDKPESMGIHGPSVSRLKREIPSNWVKVESVNYTPRISRICDAATRRIAHESGKSEIDVEKTDVEIIGLVFSYADTGKKVGVIFKDNAMKGALQRLLDSHAPRGTVTIIEPEQLIRQL